MSIRENYGNGLSTGLDQTALGKMPTGFVPADATLVTAAREEAGSVFQ